jgi:hypothetical protein
MAHRAQERVVQQVLGVGAVAAHALRHAEQHGSDPGEYGLQILGRTRLQPLPLLGHPPRTVARA